MRKLIILLVLVLTLVLASTASSSAGKPPTRDQLCGYCDGGGGLPYCYGGYNYGMEAYYGGVWYRCWMDGWRPE